ncbi:tpnC protein [Escherichia albertii]|uniref:tpnC protein n=1 Tax=Escherichia coli TaxID=562 RepID=UPI00092E818B|nr:tpnC protein [Escherichia albertii]EEV9344398.1 tpnC protein [Escherichia coli]EFW6853609.1 tpnC protein [Shigella sonnei]EEW2719456.1 tpnC protein [Escherichia coli]EEW4295782.1 tpnC protein [Escherichia coli]
MNLKIRDRLGYMSNTSSNFERTGTLLGQELRKRKTPQEKIHVKRETIKKPSYVYD